MKKRGFNETFGDKSGARPECTLRRLTPEEVSKRNLPPDNTVGIFWGRDLVAVVDFDDLFDQDGNYFKDD